MLGRFCFLILCVAAIHLLCGCGEVTAIPEQETNNSAETCIDTPEGYIFGYDESGHAYENMYCARMCTSNVDGHTICVDSNGVTMYCKQCSNNGR